MEFVSVRDLRLNPGDVWKDLSKAGELILTSRGTPIALLTTVTAQNLEETLNALRRAKAQIAVTHMRQQAAKSGIAQSSEQEIETEIQTVRKNRQKRQKD